MTEGTKKYYMAVKASYVWERKMYALEGEKLYGAGRTPRMERQLDTRIEHARRLATYWRARKEAIGVHARPESQG
jgi:hypothetical protein